LHNIVYSDLDPPGKLQTGRWRPDLDFAIDYNVYWLTGGKPLEIAAVSWDKWREWGFDKHSVVADPLFEDVSKEDFRLKAGSPALGLGFKPIDVSRVGLRGYAPPK
ncbi:hypothetical protein KKB55_01395, partial [Myxococcota bacterium]|nr:hypothetical protein [Myxococcota bacterium]